MTGFNFNRHPVCMVSQWAHLIGDDWLASLSRYRYVPQQINDPREQITIALGDLTTSWLDAQLAALPEDHELAFHSLLKRKEHELHIPMIDFMPREGQQQEIVSWAYQHLGIHLTLFDSGRSLHGYGDTPVSRDKWFKLMGLMLLANRPNQQNSVDIRWVGHQLLAGYSALRWSKNSSHYRKIPDIGF